LLPRVLSVLAHLRHESSSEIALQTAANTLQVLRLN